MGLLTTVLMTHCCPYFRCCSPQSCNGQTWARMDQPVSSGTVPSFNGCDCFLRTRKKTIPGSWCVEVGGNMSVELLGAPGIATRSKKLLGAKGIATRNKDATRGKVNGPVRFLGSGGCSSRPVDPPPRPSSHGRVLPKACKAFE